MLRAETVTLTDWIRDAKRSLARAGVLSSRNEAERLAAFGLQLRWGELWTGLRDPIEASSRARLDELLARRCAGDPLAYIVGSVEFCGTELACGPGVLVPRPETETLVDVALELLAGRREPIVVDIGTGTGAVAIAIAHSRRDARLWATEVSTVALGYAARNIESVGVSVGLLRGDLYGSLPDDLLGAVDLVVSNPPYVPDGVALPPDVQVEPAVALRGGPRGDEVLVRLVDGVTPWLNVGGSLAVEVGTPEQAASVTAAMGDFVETGTRSDHVGRPRVVWAKR